MNRAVYYNKKNTLRVKARRHKLHGYIRGLLLEDKAVHFKYDLLDRHIYYFFGCPSKKRFEVVPEIEGNAN